MLIVDDSGSFLASVFGTSAGAGAGAECTDDEEPEALQLPFFDRFLFNFLGGVVTARIKQK